MITIKNKKELAAFVAKVPAVIETQAAYEADHEGCEEEFEEIKNELVKLLATEDGSPDFGEDWEAWLTSERVEELLQEAISIVM